MASGDMRRWRRRGFASIMSRAAGLALSIWVSISGFARVCDKEAAGSACKKQELQKILAPSGRAARGACNPDDRNLCVCRAMCCGNQQHLQTTRGTCCA